MQLRCDPGAALLRAAGPHPAFDKHSKLRKLLGINCLQRREIQSLHSCCQAARVEGI